ncbi:MAG: hypothetical protein IJN28_07265 [Selenomonadales bacterium]|nr:hypothetical protein [Selenomonadales bacterium]
MYKAILLAGALLSALHTGDWARYLWQRGKRPQAAVISLLCALVLVLAVRAVGVV